MHSSVLMTRKLVAKLNLNLHMHLTHVYKILWHSQYSLQRVQHSATALKQSQDICHPVVHILVVRRTL
ncbi:hypothetical protein BC629DRAFT_1451164, partial [Irpex lacteus]